MNAPDIGAGHFTQFTKLLNSGVGQPSDLREESRNWTVMLRVAALSTHFWQSAICSFSSAMSGPKFFWFPLNLKTLYNLPSPSLYIPSPSITNMPIDINYLREYKLSESHPLCGKPDIFREANAKRYLDPKAIDDVLAIDEEWRSASSDISTLRQKANEIQKNVIAPAKKAKLPCEEAVAEVKVLKEKIALLEKTIPLIEARRAKELRRVGNIVDAEVPFSKDEDNDSLVVNLNPLPENVSLPCRIADLQSPPPPTAPLQHDELLWRIDGYEPAKGVAVAGHRGYFLKNAGVMLNQALINYGIAFLRKREYEVLQPPYFMNKDVMAGIAQLDDFDEQLYKVSGKTDDPDGGEFRVAMLQSTYYTHYTNIYTIYTIHYLC